ncbi:BatA domain-containing protein [Candidatus Woesearchaeota archaeon]|nr:BatA domain-containing protein [Candidatus Woesearchaeota archaeon]
MVLAKISGLYVLLAILPFIAIYLIRPKSFMKDIPSLMFILKERRETKQSSFLQKFFSNPLFYLQLLVLLLLGFGAAEPSFEISREYVVKNSVILLDASGSMQASDGSATRWEVAVREAKNNLGLKNTIILAENYPLILLEGGTKREALDVLAKARPKATSSNIGDALLLAGDLLGDKKGAITVLSDFLPTEGSDITLAKRTIETRGHAVSFVPLKLGRENVGIISLDVGKSETVLGIKNFNGLSQSISVVLEKEGRKIGERELSLHPGSMEKASFPTPAGTSTITLKGKDDLPLDDVAFVSSPLKKEVRVLLITNVPEGNKIKAALKAMGDVILEIREPPSINAYNINHDLVIISDITPKLFVPTDFRDLFKYVEKGGALVMAAQEDFLAVVETLKKEGLESLLPITPKGLQEQQTDICVVIVGAIFGKDPYADEPCFSSMNKFIRAEAKNDTLIIANAARDRSPLMVSQKVGDGEIFYYGILDKYSGFFADSFYPVFWKNVLYAMLSIDDISSFNFKSGQILAPKNKAVNTPSGSLETKKLLLDESGFYSVDGKVIAVNMINEKESQISGEGREEESRVIAEAGEATKGREIFNLSLPLLIIALMLLAAEVAIMKFRGDM